MHRLENPSARITTSGLSPACTCCTARQLTAGTPATRPETALWSDGIHLSELGDTLLFQIVERHLSDTGLIQALTRYDVRERTEALATYRHLFAAVRA